MSTTETMTPAERLAALKLLEHAVKEAIATAIAAADEFRQATRSKQLETDYGLVYVARSQPKIKVDDVALLAWAEEHAPHLITRTISPPAKTALLKGWVIDGDDVVDDNGEVIVFATVVPGGAESLMVRLSPEAKDMAASVMGAHAAQLADGFAGMLTAFASHQITKEV